MTRRVRRENRALINFKDAVSNKSTRHGYRLNEIIKRPQDIYAALTKSGLIDEYVNYYRGQLGYFERNFLTISQSFLEEYREDIMECIEDQTCYKAEDGYQWLQFACTFSNLLGMTLSDSPIVNALAEEFKTMKRADVNRLLSN